MARPPVFKPNSKLRRLEGRSSNSLWQDNFSKIAMRPESVVLLFSDQQLWRYELFYSRVKAERAFRRAAKEGILETEDGGFSGTSAQTTARIVHFDWLATAKEPWRKSLLNLSEDEMIELCSRFDLPRNIVEGASQAERDTLERKRYHLSKYDEHTTALMRKYLPRYILNWIFY